MIERRLLFGLVAIGFSLSFAPLAKAQAELNRGIIEGIVSGTRKGAVVPGVGDNYYRCRYQCFRDHQEQWRGLLPGGGFGSGEI